MGSSGSERCYHKLKWSLVSEREPGEVTRVWSQVGQGSFTHPCTVDRRLVSIDLHPAWRVGRAHISLLLGLRRCTISGNFLRYGPF